MDKFALITQMNETLDQVRDFLHNDGGDVQVVDIDENNKVYILFSGSCLQCKSKEFTKEIGIFETLKVNFPQITGLLEVN
ncbi:MAG: NifU family protein [Chitinophagales bacterium]|jgi:Fe-S cluster biogenesis protein NfuA|nr:NifU family protein [Chitinophagales bacterium]